MSGKGLIFKASKPPLIDYIHKAIVVYERSSTEALKILSDIAQDACRVLRAMLLALPEDLDDREIIREKAVIASMLSAFCEQGYIPRISVETRTQKTTQRTLDEFIEG